MPGSTDRRRLPRTHGRRLAGAVAATAAALAYTLATGMSASADVKPADPSTVAAALHADKVPAAIVVLVDISRSMSASRGGPYPQVRQELPRFLTTLANQDPQDRVAVIV